MNINIKTCGECKWSKKDNESINLNSCKNQNSIHYALKHFDNYKACLWAEDKNDK